MSILGIGVDLCDIKRVESSLEKHGDLFAEKILHENEKARFAQIKHQARYLAKRFAAKEAFAKAMGTGIAQGVAFPLIEIFNDNAGKPGILLHETTKAKFEAIGGVTIFLSISDEKQYAIAQVIIEG